MGDAVWRDDSSAGEVEDTSSYAFGARVWKRPALLMITSYTPGASPAPVPVVLSVLLVLPPDAVVLFDRLRPSAPR
jgi:hypothetical protein